MTQAPAPWIHRTEPARQLVALGFALTLSAVAIDHLLSGRLTFFFDICFVALCLLLALRAAPGSFYVAAILPPVLMLGVFVLLGLIAPQMVGRDDDGLAQTVVSGFAHHSVALVIGYAVCLLALYVRADGRFPGWGSDDD